MKQETHKGRGALDPAGASWAGWEFAEHEELVIEIPTTYATVRDYSAAEANAANAANPLVFAGSPVFRKNPPGMFTNSIPVTLRNELLAKGIPALSGATGTMSVNIADNAGNVIPGRNHDMNSVSRPNGRPRPPTEAPYGQRWKHSDLKDVAFFFNYNVFKDVVAKGGLE